MTRPLMIVVLACFAGPAHAQRSLHEAVPDCDVADFIELPDSSFYACADGRLIELYTLPSGVVIVRSTAELPSDFVRFGDGDELTIERARRGRVPVRALAGRGRAGRVRAIAGRHAVLAGGGFAEGERVALMSPDRLDEQVLAVGPVVLHEDGRSTVSLGMGEVVPIGARAVPTDRSVTADPWLPTRRGNMWQIVVGARPFLSVHQQALLGIAPSFSLRYRAGAPFVVSGDWDPIGIGPGTFGTVGLATAFFGLVGIDMREIEISVGAGAATNTVGCCTSLAFTLAQRVRIGALDGLSIEATMLEGFAGNDRVLLHSLSARVELPLEALGWARDVWLVARGGGGAAGYGLGELGVKLLFLGNGWRRTLFMTFAAGAFGMSPPELGVPRRLLVGPSLNAELEARF